LLTDQGFVFFHGMFGMNPDQGKKIRINRYVGISLAKLHLDCRTLTYPQLFSPLLLSEEM